MKLAILGYGRMGKEVERQAHVRGHQVTAVFDIEDNFSPTAELNGAEAIISFVLADSVLTNIKSAAHCGVPIVEGTTGWYGQLDQLKQIIEEAQSGN